MFDKKEAVFLLVAALVLGYAISFKGITWTGWIIAAGLALLMLFIHHLGQKMTALFYDCSAETNLWTIRQFWLAKKSHFGFEFPMWFATPIFLMLFSFGYVKWLAVTTFEPSPLPSRIKRVYSELTEWDIAMIAVGGLFFNAVAAVISKALGYDSFAMLNLYFILFNLAPISKLDGGKVFFGSPMLWIFCVVFALMLLLLLETASLATLILAAIAVALAAVVIYYISMNS